MTNKLMALANGRIMLSLEGGYVLLLLQCSNETCLSLGDEDCQARGGSGRL